ncbi:MAG: M48 family metalloprotease [Fimbriimonas sp.]
MKQIILGTILAFGMSTHLSSAPNRQDFSKTDTQTEIELGRSYFDSMSKYMTISQNQSYKRRVERILNQLVGSMPYRPYPFQAVVIADNEVNAGCYPGGFMVVNEGLLVKMPNDNQLAFTLGHEMGHAVRRHWARTTRINQTDTMLDIFSVLLTGASTGVDNTLKMRAYGRDLEREADDYGTELYLKAGFPPEHIGDGMRVIIDISAEDKSVPEYLLTHPQPENRLSSIMALSNKLLKNGLTPNNSSSEIDTSIKRIFGHLPTIAASGSSLQPMEPGTTWTYSVESPSGASTYKTSVVGCSDVLSSKVARFETTIGERTIPFQLMAEEKRIYRRNRPDREDSKWSTEIMFPEFGGIEEVQSVKYRLVGIETVVTPAGTFPACYKVQYKNENDKLIESWYKSQVGMVKRTNVSSNVTETLIIFNKGNLLTQ